MKYRCERCGYECKRRSDLLRHLSRIDPCIQKLSSISILDLKKKYHFIDHIGKQKNSASYEHECRWCQRKYKFKYNLNKHLKTCSVRKTVEQSQKEDHVEDLLVQIQQLESLVREMMSNTSR